MSGQRKIKGRYETVETIGRGGMGVVYKAFDTVIKREVALKTIRDLPSRTALDLFRKECGVLATMSHPNIVEIFDIGEFEEEGASKPYFVMPLLPGVTLDHLIKTSSQRLTVERAIEIILQTCRGLQAAHERGLVHRDLKPSNIFVMPDDSVKIIDFGVAHMSDARATMTMAAGTLPYMAPEQLELKPATPLSDIFSLGVLFYETLTRRRPFDFPTERETLDAIRHLVPPPTSELNPSVPPVISRVIHKAMAKQPWNRFSSAREMADTLQKALRNEPIEIFDTSRIQPRIQRATKAYEQGNYQFAGEILNELEAEGHMDTNISMLRRQLGQAVRQKTIAQLLDSARNCMEEEEFLLALQKIQEVLQLEPANASALVLKTTIENRRNEQKVEEWLRLARQHLENNAFGHARDALQNLLQLRPKDSAAQQMLAEVDRREQDYVRAREEKKLLYEEALEAWKSGEMSSALTKLEKLVELDRRVPDTSTPERGVSYQNFYNQVRSEHDTIRNAYQEARKNLVDGNFTGALGICQEYLSRYPGHALFQALKFDVEERQRQEISARIAEIDRRVEAEPDLERRVNILKQALEAHPGESHFEKALRLMRDKRDLVNSIVAKARSYEERGQFNEALGQWEILQTIHKQYPGLDFEIERVVKRRDQQARAEAKARWVDQIDRHLEAPDYTRATEVLRNALAEFPGDTELVALRELVEQKQARAAQAQQLFAQGLELRGQARFDDAVEALRQAYRLDERNAAVRGALVETLLEQGRLLLETDWRTADALSRQALELEPEHSLARSLSALASDRKREEMVSRGVAEARRMQASGNVREALGLVERVLAAYPREARLMQLQATLAKSLGETQSRTEATWSAAPEPTPPRAMSAAGATAAAATGPAAPAAPPPAVPEPVSMRAAAVSAPAAGLAGTQAPVGEAGVAEPSASPLLDSGEAPHLATMLVSQTQAPVAPPEPPAAVPEFAPPTPAPPRKPAVPRSRLPLWMAGAAAATLLVAGGLGYWFWPAAVEVRTQPPGATVRIGGAVRGTSNLRLRLRPGTYQVQVSREGYLPAAASLTARRGGTAAVDLVLQPAARPSAPRPAQSLRVSTDLSAGQVTVDEQPAAELQDGQFALEAVGWGSHAVKVNSGRLEAVVRFEAAADTLPAVADPLTAKEVKALVVASQGDRARIHCNCGPAAVTLDGQPRGQLGPAPLELTGLAEGNHELALAEGKDTRKVNFTVGAAPAVFAFLNSDRNVGTLLVLTGEDDVKVLLNGKEYRRPTRGGQLRISNLMVKEYTIAVQKDGYQQEPEQRVALRKGEEARVEFRLRPMPTVATLVLRGAMPGMQVSLDQKALGVVQPDGSFSHPNIAPGEHTIELSERQYRIRRLSKTFRAGETVQLSAAEVALERTLGTLQVSVAPAGAVITLRRADGRVLPFRGPSLEVEEGSYTVQAQAPGYEERSEAIQIAAGRTHSIDWKLAPRPTAALRKALSMEEWARAGGWSRERQWFVRRGGDLVLYPSSPTAGTFVFTAFRRGGVIRSGRIQWVVNCADARNYVLFQIDRKTFSRSEFVNGRKVREEKRDLPELPDLEGNAVQASLRIEIAGDRVSHSIHDGSRWIALENWIAPGRDLTRGRFGFYLPGNDEVLVSNFSFTPK